MLGSERIIDIVITFVKNNIAGNYPGNGGGIVRIGFITTNPHHNDYNHNSEISEIPKENS